jgi:hypothetical protein
MDQNQNKMEETKNTEHEELIMTDEVECNDGDGCCDEVHQNMDELNPLSSDITEASGEEKVEVKEVVSGTPEVPEHLLSNSPSPNE